MQCYKENELNPFNLKQGRILIIQELFTACRQIYCLKKAATPVKAAAS
jgi:hypothetical protein